MAAKVDEPFATSMENAWHKARYYARLVRIPVLAVDEELYTNFLPEHLQPGVPFRHDVRQSRARSAARSIRGRL